MMYTRKNHNGSYRIPLQALSGMSKMLEVDGGPSPALIGELVDQLGRYEELGDVKELEKMINERGGRKKWA